MKGEHILDGGRSIIDAYAFPMIRWAIKMLPGGLEGYPNVQALHDRSRPIRAFGRCLLTKRAVNQS